MSEQTFDESCGGCKTWMHCTHHGRCLAECTPQDVACVAGEVVPCNCAALTEERDLVLAEIDENQRWIRERDTRIDDLLAQIARLEEELQRETDRFPDAVLKQALYAYHGAKFGEGYAAMRAVLENHLKTHVCAWCEHFIDDHDAHGCKIRGCVCMPITKEEK